MNFTNFQFEHPWVLFLGLLVLILHFIAKRTIRKRQQIPYPPLQYKSGKLSSELPALINYLAEILLFIFIFCSLAGPFNSHEIVSIQEEGIDVLIAVDVSSSMQATDFTPNRLEATKKIIKQFVRKSGGNRIGIVVFGKHVFSLSSFTNDHYVLNKLIDGISLWTIDHSRSGGTAIGDAILYSTDMLMQARIKGRGQVMILLTDGENNIGIDPIRASKFAISEGIKIHTIGIGSTKPITVKPDPKDPNWSFQSKLADAPLKEIAKLAGGKYFHALNNALLSKVFQELSILERTPLDVKHIKQRKYMRLPFHAGAGIAFLISFLIKMILMRRPIK